MITTYEEARAALMESALELAEEKGQAAVDESWRDLLNDVTSRCTPEIAAALTEKIAGKENP